jgi:hypothetical protein
MTTEKQKKAARQNIKKAQKKAHTKKQRETARENIKKAQKKWKSLSSQTRSRRQPEGRAREKPGAGGEGDYYHIEIRDKDQFTSFRTHDVGRGGHSQRVAGRRSSGSWATQKWLISKEDAHREDDELVADDEKVEKILDSLRGKIKHVKGDIYEAKPRRNVPEGDKPTRAQKRARKKNITKAQEARW